MRGLVLATLFVLMAGCEAGGPSYLPDDWDHGTLLLPSEMFGDHGGGRGATLYPTKTMVEPAYCLAFRDNATVDGDTCTIEAPQYASEQGHGPWLIRASWQSCPTHDFGGCHDNDYPKPYLARVVAYNGAHRWPGGTVAWGRTPCTRQSSLPSLPSGQDP
jgi:hypothetical protein